MIDWRQFQTPAWMALYAALGVTLIATQVLPVGLDSRHWPAPDLLAGMTLAWVLRRPAQVPALLIVAVVVLEDLLLMRPPGLWALFMLAGTEFLRNRRNVAREVPFMVEWALVAAVLLVLSLGYRISLVVLFTAPPPLGLSVVQLMGTVLAYPAIVGVLFSVFRLRKPATGEVDELGHKL